MRNVIRKYRMHSVECSCVMSMAPTSRTLHEPPTFDMLSLPFCYYIYRSMFWMSCNLEYLAWEYKLKLHTQWHTRNFQVCLLNTLYWLHHFKKMPYHEVYLYTRAVSEEASWMHPSYNMNQIGTHFCYTHTICTVNNCEDCIKLNREKIGTLSQPGDQGYAKEATHLYNDM